MKFRNWIFALVGLVLVSPVLLLGYIWLRIKYLPLPPIPRDKVSYTIRDAGTNGEELTAFYDYEGKNSWRLTDDGKVVFNAQNGSQEKKVWKQTRDQRAQNLGLSAYDVTGIESNKTLVRGRNQLELWEERIKKASCSARIAAYPKWPVYDAELLFFGANSDIIGNGRIATAPASSGGASDSHGRIFPIIWDGKSPLLRDLNSTIDAKSGWYLYRALDVNERGQILCIGEKTDALGAEKSDYTKFRQLVLTPTESPKN